MKREDIQKLLGGYATGTLTAEEQQALFEAALDDQELFDTLAREQSLRDLLRDPGTRAQLLAALDSPPAHGQTFWQWLRRPLAIGTAVAGMAAVAVVMVRQATQAPKQVMVAEVRERPVAPQAVAPQALPQPQPEAGARQLPKATRRAAPAEPGEPGAKMDAPAEFARAPRPDTEPAKKETAKDETKRALTPPASSTAVGVQASAATGSAENQAVVAGAAPLVVQQQALRRSMLSGAVPPAASPTNQGAVSAENARTLFYGIPPVASLLAEGSVKGNAMVESGGAGGGAGGSRPSPKAVAPAPMKANSIAVADSVAPAVHLGVRCSILRGATEADPATVLDPGEPVRLKIIPNDNGFLYVRERNAGGAWVTVASGVAERFKPFETPVLRFEGTGQKELSVLFTRQRQAGQGGALPMDAIPAPRNLIQTAAEQDRATYVVTRDNTGLQQVVAPITLTYR